MTRRQRFTLVAAILGSSVAAIDGTIVNVALPAIQNDLGGGLQAQQWISNAYLLTLGSLILIGGSLGDIYGRRRVFALGIGAFGVLSVACAAAPNIDTLIAARALQGVAGAALTPSSASRSAGRQPQRAVEMRPSTSVSRCPTFSTTRNCRATGRLMPQPSTDSRRLSRRISTDPLIYLIQYLTLPSKVR